LAAEVSGKVWLFTLGPKGGTTPGGTNVVEIGPVPVFAAPEYLLRINHAGGPPGAKTPVHSHPGSESFYVLAGQVSQRTSHGVNRTEAGQTMVGHGPDMPMEVSSSGTIELDQLVMFLLDATRPASVPAKLD
jgi:anti-sigma factor ChrR (cupin superfamily)